MVSATDLTAQLTYVGSSGTDWLDELAVVRRL